MVVESGYFEDVVVGSALLNVYGKHSNLTMARRVFERMENRNFVTWSSMIGAYSRNGASHEALKMFMRMDSEGVKPSNITFLGVVEACDNHRDARTIHRRIEETCGFESDTKLGNALVNMYGKCGLVNEAWSVFDRIPEKSIISWSIMIEVYATNKREEQALYLFKLMDLHGEKPQEITFTIVVDACASIPSLQQGRTVHSLMAESQLDSGVYMDAQLANSLINMYGKCASVQDARNVFDSMCMPDIISWTAMVTAYAENGEDHEALGFFQEMKLNGVKPNRITFLNVLSACSHAGLLENGCKEFVSMSTDFGVEANVDHYICLIDLLARSGRLEEAEEVVYSMPFEPDGVVWSTLLGGSRMHGDGGKASAFAGNACEYEDQAKHSATYVLLCETNRCRISTV